MILMCYDGSEDAKAAIAHSASLLKDDQPVTVLTVWQPPAKLVGRMHTGGFRLAASGFAFEEVDAASSKSTKEMAQEGTELERTAARTLSSVEVRPTRRRRLSP